VSGAGVSGEQAAQQVAPAVPRGETFRFLSTYWDVDRLNADLDANPDKVFTARPVNIRGGIVNQDGVDRSFLDSLEHPERPVIVIGVQAGGRTHQFIVDGNHRLTRALRDGQEQIRVYVVPPEREGEFRI